MPATTETEEKGSIRVNLELHERMKALAAIRGQHVAFVYEKAAEQYLNREEKKAKEAKK